MTRATYHTIIQCIQQLNVEILKTKKKRLQSRHCSVDEIVCSSLTKQYVINAIIVVKCALS